MEREVHVFSIGKDFWEARQGGVCVEVGDEGGGG